MPLIPGFISGFTRHFKSPNPFCYRSINGGSKSQRIADRKSLTLQSYNQLDVDLAALKPFHEARVSGLAMQYCICPLIDLVR